VLENRLQVELRSLRELATGKTVVLQADQAWDEKYPTIAKMWRAKFSNHPMGRSGWRWMRDYPSSWKQGQLIAGRPTPSKVRSGVGDRRG